MTENEDYVTLAGMSAAALDAIRERLVGITPTPWAAGMEIDEDDAYWSSDHVHAVDALPVAIIPRGLDHDDSYLDEFDKAHDRGTICETHNYWPITHDQHTANQILIAHAPDDLVALLAHVGELRGLLDEALTLLREVWSNGNAEGRLGELWNLAGRIDAVLDPASTPVFVPAHNHQGSTR